MGSDRAWIIFILAFVTGWSWGLKPDSRPPSEEPALWSLRCLYAGEEECKFAPKEFDRSGVENATFDYLEQIFDETEEPVRAAFFRRDLSSLPATLACEIPKLLLLVLPVKYLSTLNGELLGRLIECNTDDLAVVRLIASAIARVSGPYSFYTEVQSMKLDENSLSILGEGIATMSLINSPQWLVSENQSIVEYLSPNIIMDEKNELLQSMRNIEPLAWSKRPSRVKRIWAYALARRANPQMIADWDDTALQSLGHLLIGATVDELEELSPNLIQHKRKLFEHPFTVTQIRGIFDDFYRYHDVDTVVYSQVKATLHRLLPKHLQQFKDGCAYFQDHTNVNEPTSLATSRQLVEYLVHCNRLTSSLEEFVSDRERLMALNQLLYSLPLSFFKRLNYTLTFPELLLIQSDQWSMAQLYHLTNAGELYKLSTEGVYGAHSVLKGLPTQLLSRILPSTVFIYLMAELPGTVLPRTASILDEFIFQTGYEHHFRNLLRNQDAETYLNILPSKYVELHNKEMWLALENHLERYPGFGAKIPEHMLSVFLSKTADRDLSWASFSRNNHSHLFPLLLRALSCSDIESMSPLDFIHVISRFNSLRQTFGWSFPKDLQTCSLQKFVDYLEMKSSFMTNLSSSSLAFLITASDVEAIGGFVLTQLPLTDLRIAPPRELIIKTIGKLSLPELLEASSINKLVDIGELYYRPELGKDVFNLGNLTAFLTATNIESFHASDFKLMLESGYLDRRVCAMDTQRDAWANLVLQAFGPPEQWKAQDLVTLGDMLMVIPYHDLTKVDPRVWADAADVIAKTRYFENVEVSKQQTAFFNEVCENWLSDSYEGTTYRRELGEFVGWLLAAAQYQLDSVVNVTSLRKGIRTTPFSRPKLTVDVDGTDSLEKEDDPSWHHIFPFTPFKDRNGGYATRITCDAIRMVGQPAQLFLTSTMINEIGSEEIENCKEELGRMDLPKDVGLSVWTKLDQSSSPHLAGKLLSHASPSEVLGWNLSFDHKWAHETLYYLSNFNRDENTISAVVTKVNDQKLSLLSMAQVVTLGPLLCQLPAVTVTATVFFKASRYLGSSFPCHRQCLRYFTQFFENVDAYGPMSTWTPDDVDSLGILIAGLELKDWTPLVEEKPNVLSRMGIRALQCLSNDHLQALTVDAIHKIPASTAAFLLDRMSLALNSTVKEALEARVNPKIDWRTPDLPKIVYIWDQDRFVPTAASGDKPRHLPMLLTTFLIPLLIVILY